MLALCRARFIAREDVLVDDPASVSPAPRKNLGDTNPRSSSIASRPRHRRAIGRALPRSNVLQLLNDRRRNHDRAARRVIYAADAIGIRGWLVHARPDDPAAFYPRLRLYPMPLDSMTLMVTLADLTSKRRNPVVRDITLDAFARMTQWLRRQTP
jgi:hypothetical protein